MSGHFKRRRVFAFSGRGKAQATPSATIYRALIWGLGGVLAGCTPIPPTQGVSRAGPLDEEALLVPPGFGSLRQDEITLTFTSGIVQVKVTPLEEWAIRLTAPDTYQRLSGLARLTRSQLNDRGGEEGAALFLVSFYSLMQGESFQPEDVYIENRSRRHRPRTIRPVTRDWGTGRLTQRNPQTAVYAYDSWIDLTLDMSVEYQGVRNMDWTFILQRLQAESSRARTRANVRGWRQAP